MVRVRSRISIDFIDSSDALMSLAASGAQVPFSTRATRLSQKPFIASLSRKHFIGGNMPPSYVLQASTMVPILNASAIASATSSRQRSVTATFGAPLASRIFASLLAAAAVLPWIEA